MTRSNNIIDLTSFSSEEKCSLIFEVYNNYEKYREYLSEKYKNLDGYRDHFGNERIFENRFSHALVAWASTVEAKIEYKNYLAKKDKESDLDILPYRSFANHNLVKSFNFCGIRLTFNFEEMCSLKYLHDNRYDNLYDNDRDEFKVFLEARGYDEDLHGSIISAITSWEKSNEGAWRYGCFLEKRLQEDDIRANLNPQYRPDALPKIPIRDFNCQINDKSQSNDGIFISASSNVVDLNLPPSYTPEDRSPPPPYQKIEEQYADHIIPTAPVIPSGIVPILRRTAARLVGLVRRQNRSSRVAAQDSTSRNEAWR